MAHKLIPCALRNQAPYPPKFAMSKVVCIIDAYSSGAFLAQHFSERGYELIHIQSSKYLPSFLLESFPIGIFCKTWLNDCLFEELVSQLRSQQPQAVIAGAETGVILAELLANRLGLATNLPELGAARQLFAELAFVELAIFEPTV